LPVALCVALAACGSDGPENAATNPAAAADHGGHAEARPAAPDARRIDVTGRSFAFEPKAITATVGEEIAIALTSSDSLHDFTIDELDAHVAADPGKTVIGGFRAEKAGRYTFYCSVTGHREAGMTGTLTVTDTASAGPS
jgi:plastocyanin